MSKTHKMQDNKTESMFKYIIKEGVQQQNNKP